MTGAVYYTPEPPPKTRKVFVSYGISEGDEWMAVYEKYPYKKGSHRLKSPALPIRGTEKEAQEDLDRYAASHGFRKEESGNAERYK